MKIFYSSCFLLSFTILSACKTQDTTTIQFSPTDEYRNCRQSNTNSFAHVLPCYVQTLAKQPLNYRFDSNEQLSAHLSLKRYTLYSQQWSPNDQVSPSDWQHQVDMYIPDQAQHRTALLVINNGTRKTENLPRINPNDFDPETLAKIAEQTQSIVISVSDIPNQPLLYAGQDKAVREDESVAQSWKFFMQNPAQYELLPLHIPMVASVSQAIGLAQKELSSYGIKKFIITGASKRAWTAWLTALSNPDVEAIVPFVFDLLNTQKGLSHMYYSYGQNWPIAFAPYYQADIDHQIENSNFTQFMQIEDPLQYMYPTHTNQTNITTYIINASGDDFYVPDNSRFYFNDLSTDKTLRVAPNSDHHGILNFTESSLIPFLNRYQNYKASPNIEEFISNQNLSLKFSETPIKIVQWTALNPEARDFRLACGIRYSSTPLKIQNNTLDIPLITPNQGWQATFIEATYADGFIGTSQVYITPDIYPNKAPSIQTGACQTRVGRGLK